MEAAYEVATRHYPIEYVVFTGGEALLLGEVLFQAIAFFKNHQVASRLISNGYWGRSSKSATLMAQKLADSGLTELNVSTGSFHREFVAIPHALRAARAAVEAGVRTLVNCELRPEDEDTLDTVMGHLRELEQPLAQRLLFMVSHAMPTYQYSEDEFETALVETRSRGNPLWEQRELAGCDKILTSVTVLPTGAYVSCCGLTMPQIPDLYLGFGDLPQLVARDREHSLKIAIHAIGPLEILRRVAVVAREAEPNLRFPKVSHPCHACRVLHNTPSAHAIAQQLVALDSVRTEVRSVLRALRHKERHTYNTRSDLKDACEGQAYSSVERSREITSL